MYRTDEKATRIEKTKRKFSVTAVLLPAALTLQVLARLVPGFAEWYAVTVYPWLPGRHQQPVSLCAGRMPHLSSDLQRSLLRLLGDLFHMEEKGQPEEMVPDLPGACVESRGMVALSVHGHLRDQLSQDAVLEAGGASHGAFYRRGAGGTLSVADRSD